MALADYAAPIADDDNPLLPWVRVRDGVIETEWPGHALRPAAGARALAVPERTVRVSRAADGRTRGRHARSRCRAPHGTSPNRAGWRRRVQREGDAASPSAARGGRRVRVPPHGRWRPGVGCGGRCGVGLWGRHFASISATSISDRHTIDPSLKRASGRRAFRHSVSATCRAASPSCWARAGSSCGSRAPWSTARARSGIAACSRGPIASTCEIASIWCSSGECGTSRSAPACSRARLPGCSRTGRAGATAR